MPMLFLLRLADRNTPAMDQLYFYVRKMDSAIHDMKDVIDKIEGEISNSISGEPIGYKMICKFYLKNSRNKVAESTITNRINSLCARDKNHEDDGSDDDSDSEGNIVDDLVDEDETNTDTISNVIGPTHGTAFVTFWEKRSEPLRHDVSIAAWICSPRHEVMLDASENMKGYHIEAVNRVLKKWLVTAKVSLYIGLLCVHYSHHSNCRKRFCCVCYPRTDATKRPTSSIPFGRSDKAST